MSKILYGICGIGSGHTHRQLPIIDHLSREHEIVLFAYGESLAFYSEHFRGSGSVTVVPVAVPFYVGNSQGLDFAATARRLRDWQVNYGLVNAEAMARAQSLLGRPDLVVSDYEPVSAQYAYAVDAPLVTIDQQSKYLVGDFSLELDGHTAKDEVARLRMFFPEAQARIACSFFRVAAGAGDLKERVRIYPPVIKPAIAELKSQRAVVKNKSVLVYISSQRDFVQTIAEVAAVCASQPKVRFHLFVPNTDGAPELERTFTNVSFYRHGDPRFLGVLRDCSAVITTGGHTLLSECMYLGIPAYVIPLGVYEQQMNAHIINTHEFGVSRPLLTAAHLKDFIRQMPTYAGNIARDRRILMRGSAEASIIRFLEEQFLE